MASLDDGDVYQFVRIKNASEGVWVLER